MTLKEKQKLRKKLFILWSKAVKNRDDNKCVICKTTERLNSHHLINRNIKDCPLKFDIRNGITLCVSHHKYNPVFSAHKGSLNFYNWFINIYGKMTVDYLVKHSASKIDLNNEDILKSIEQSLLNNQALIYDDLKIIKGF